MSAPHLLLVDDSDAVLAFEQAVLSRDYTLSTAGDGREALRLVRELMPAAVLLDISMPEMDGDEVLEAMQADPELARISVIMISSEEARARACMEKGAAAYLPKPIQADVLRSLVDRVLAERVRRERVGSLTTMELRVGGFRFGLPLECVVMVVHQPATEALVGGPDFLCRVARIHGQPVAVLDLAVRLGVKNLADLVEQQLVVIKVDRHRIALCVDNVLDPVEFTADAVTLGEDIGGGRHGDLSKVLKALVKLDDVQLAVVDPASFLSPEGLALLAELSERARVESGE